MKTYSVFNGEYPFDNLIGTVKAEDEVTALYQAIEIYGKEYLHPVIAEAPVTH